ncbi:MAG TPA: hypothetical protein VNS22_19260 [Geminicoccus sp.]|nr:hypothetical protein [Geminicoccus sp.]HWL70499.1 hypothetical protein [Geminicoccus sp.]
MFYGRSRVASMIARHFQNAFNALMGVVAILIELRPDELEAEPSGAE